MDVNNANTLSLMRHRIKPQNALRAPAGEETAWPGMLWAHPVTTVTQSGLGLLVSGLSAQLPRALNRLPESLVPTVSERTSSKNIIERIERERERERESLRERERERARRQAEKEGVREIEREREKERAHERRRETH